MASTRTQAASKSRAVAEMIYDCQKKETYKNESFRPITKDFKITRSEQECLSSTVFLEPFTST